MFPTVTLVLAPIVKHLTSNYCRLLTSLYLFERRCFVLICCFQVIYKPYLIININGISIRFP